ncbi:MAG TPA: hypothetical protein VNL92_07400 [Dehalococcoidia bacterium]|nr:hypothetical protein [Dehalococcoidia bacterium]
MALREVERRFEIARALFELSHDQRIALASNELERFNELLEERKVLLLELEQEGPLSSAPYNVIPFPGEVALGARRIAQTDDAIAVQSIIRAILHIDAENEARLAARLDDMRETLSTLADEQTSGGSRGDDARPALGVGKSQP